MTRRASSWLAAGLGAWAFALGAALVLSACDKPEKASRGAAASGSAAAVSSEEAPAARFVRLRPRPAKVGQTFRFQRTSTLSLGVEFWQDGKKAGTNDSSRHEEVTRRVEVLGLVGGAPAKVRVTYETFLLEEAPSSGVPRKTRVLEGKTYVVDATASADGEPAFTREGGKAEAPGSAVSAEEKTELARLHAGTGQGDAVVAALGERPLGVGKSAKMTTALLSGLIGAGAGQVQDGKITLADIRTENGRDVANFDWEATTKTEESAGLEITSRLTGHVLVGVDPAETIAVVLQSSLEASGRTRNERGAFDLQGSGFTKEQRSTTPLEPAPGGSPSAMPSQ